MMYNCPICNSDLKEESDYFLNGMKIGTIFFCENSDGFVNEIDALDYHFKDITPKGNEGVLSVYLGEVEDIRCDSSIYHVSGSFYTDSDGSLLEGYPC